LSKLHYIYDPLCGWCYCAEPLVRAATAVPGLDLVLHGGGLWPEPTQLPEATRKYIREADTRAAAISRQPYGRKYLEELLTDPSLTLDSAPTTAAVLAAESLAAGNGLAMLQAIQHGHWEHGLHVVNADVLLQLAEAIGLDRQSFERAAANVDVDSHIARTRQLMRRIGAQGFPAFVLEKDSQWLPVPSQRFLPNPAAFGEWLGRQVRPVLH